LDEEDARLAMICPKKPSSLDAAALQE